MRREKINCSGQNSWRKPPRRLKYKKLWQRSLLNSPHVNSCENLMKSPIFIIFYQEVPLQSTVAGVSAATNYTGLSCTKHNRKPVLSNHLIHKSRAPSNFCTVQLSGTMSNEALLSTLPIAGRMVHCLHNWKQITRVVKGYRLDFTHLPFQPSPCYTTAKSSSEQRLIEKAPPEAISGQGQPQSRKVCK